MNSETWFQGLLDEYEDDLEYKIEETKLDITEAICEAMDELGITRKQLAEKMGTSAAAITKFLNGTANLTLKTLVKFSMCLERDLIVKLKAKPKKRLDPYKLFNREYIDIPLQSTVLTNTDLTDNSPEDWRILSDTFSQGVFQEKKHRKSSGSTSSHQSSAEVGELYSIECNV